MPSRCTPLALLVELAGIMVFIDGLLDEHYATIQEAAGAIEEHAGTTVRLVEHRAAIPYWTAHPRQPDPSRVDGTTPSEA